MSLETQADSCCGICQTVNMPGDVVVRSESGWAHACCALSAPHKKAGEWFHPTSQHPYGVVGHGLGTSQAWMEPLWKAVNGANREHAAGRPSIHSLIDIVRAQSARVGFIRAGLREGLCAACSTWVVEGDPAACCGPEFLLDPQGQAMRQEHLRHLACSARAKNLVGIGVLGARAGALLSEVWTLHVLRVGGLGLKTLLRTSTIQGLALALKEQKMRVSMKAVRG